MADKEIFDPTPRFRRIEEGICPDCGDNLTDSGYCLDCHIIPSLGPDYQKWLDNTRLCLEEDSEGNWQPLFSEGFM